MSEPASPAASDPPAGPRPDEGATPTGAAASPTPEATPPAPSPLPGSPAPTPTPEPPALATPAPATPAPATPAPVTPPAPSTPDATPPAPTAAPAPAAAPVPAGVRARDVRAAARTPAEIAEAVVRENQIRAKRAQKQRVAQEKAIAQAAAMNAPTLAIERAADRPAVEKVAPEKMAADRPVVEKAVALRPLAARVPVAVPARPPERIAPQPAPAPPPPAASPPPPSKAPRPVARANDRAVWLVGGALALQAVTLAFVGRAVARATAALEAATSGLQTARAPQAAPVEAAPTPQAGEPAKPAPTVASLGEGRIVCARADGKLVVLRRDATSGELVIERVYTLEEDEARDLGDDAHRAYSGLYVTDVERTRRALVEAEDRLYRDTLAHALERSDGLQRAEEAARRLARAGGADRLVRHLEDQDHVGRRTAAIALGEQGYLAAIPRVVEVLETTGDSELARHLVGVLRDLTGLAVDPTDPKSVVAKRARDWWEQNRTDDLFARRPRGR